MNSRASLCQLEISVFKCILSHVPRFLAPIWTSLDNRLIQVSMIICRCLPLSHEASSTSSFLSQLMVGPSSPLPMLQTWLILAFLSHTSSSITTPMDSTFKIFLESSNFLQPSLLPPGLSQCHTSPGYLHLLLE